MPTEIRVGSYTHTESNISTLWTITHNLGTTSPCVDVFVDDGFGKTVKLIAQTVTAVDANTVTLAFTAGQQGYAKVT